MGLTSGNPRGSAASLDFSFVLEPLVLSDSLWAGPGLTPSHSLQGPAVSSSSPLSGQAQDLPVPEARTMPREREEASRMGTCGRPLGQRHGHLCSRLRFQMLQGWTVGSSPHQPQEGQKRDLDPGNPQRRVLWSSGPRSRRIRQDQGELGTS